MAFIWIKLMPKLSDFGCNENYTYPALYDDFYVIGWVISNQFRFILHTYVVYRCTDFIEENQFA